jgi:hypothetical protein
MSAAGTVAVIAEAIRIAAPLITQIVECLVGSRDDVAVDGATLSAIQLAIFEVRRARYLGERGGGR